MLRNVTLHSVLERKVTTASETVKADLKSSGFSTELAKADEEPAQARAGPRGGEAGSAGDDDHSVWSDYRDTCSCNDADATAKRAFVRAALAEGESRAVLDLGANDGEYSMIAAERADHVVAVDGDERVVDLLYRRLRAAGDEKVLPLVMNLTDPRAASAVASAPRSSTVSAPTSRWRLPSSTATIAANVPLPEVVMWLARPSAAGRSSSSRTPTTCRCSGCWRTSRRGLFDDYRRDAFETLLSERFLVHRQETLPAGTRTIYLVEPKP